MDETTPTSRFVPDRTTLEILSALASGKTAAEAAACCNVSESTLRRRVADARSAWHVRSTVEAVVIAVREGLL